MNVHPIEGREHPPGWMEEEEEEEEKGAERWIEEISSDEK